MILVTGGAGFIGSNFIHNWFTNSEEPIIALDKLTYAGNLGNLEVLKGRSNFRFVRTDISNRKIIKKLLRDEKPRAVVNFAAESHVDRSILDPKAFINTNILGTFNLLTEANKYFHNLNNIQKKRF